MLLDYIERIREKPRAARERFVIFWSIILTGTIVLVWISVLLGGAAQPQSSNEGLTTSTLNSFTESWKSLQGKTGIPVHEQATQTRSPDQLPALQNTWEATQPPNDNTQALQTQPYSAPEIEPAQAPVLQPANPETTGESPDEAPTATEEILREDGYHEDGASLIDDILHEINVNKLPYTEPTVETSNL